MRYILDFLFLYSINTLPKPWLIMKRKKKEANDFILTMNCLIKTMNRNLAEKIAPSMLNGIKTVVSNIMLGMDDSNVKIDYWKKGLCWPIIV